MHPYTGLILLDIALSKSEDVDRTTVGRRDPRQPQRPRATRPHRAPWWQRISGIRRLA